MKKKKPAIHYAAGLRISLPRGRTLSIAGGYAACCSGRRTEAIRLSGRTTFVLSAVTCAACRKRAEGAIVTTCECGRGLQNQGVGMTPICDRCLDNKYRAEFQGEPVERVS